MMKKGFTLIEMMTALSIFAIVMTISMGSILSIFDTNRRSESLRAVMDNLNLALESMSREMRFGTRYHCGLSGDLTSPQNCSSGGSAVAFRSTDGSKTIVYRQNGTVIEKSDDGGLTYIPVTAPEITVEDLSFYVLGTGSQAPQPEQQPRVLIKVKGTAGDKAVAETDFTLQTLVSQRLLDN